MKNINAIKEEIISVIKPNDNEEITGQVLQDVLVNTVDSLGAAFDEQIKEGAEVGAETKIGTNAIIGENTMLGTATKIGTGCYIGSGVKIQPNFVVGAPNININVESVPSVGAKFSITAGGYRAEEGYGISISHGATIGSSVIGDGVRIGSNVTISDAVSIGEGAAIAGGVFIGTSAAIGNDVAIGSNLNISGGITITFDSAGINIKTGVGQAKIYYN